jgi:CRISPR-associated protein Csd1
MILQRLAEHYDRIITSGNEDKRLPPNGFSRQKVSFCIVLDVNGKLNAFQSMTEQKGNKQVASKMTLPGFTKSSGSGQNPCFLWDNAAYILGYKAKDQNPKTTNKQFESFRDKHLSLQASISHPSFDAVCLFLKSWNLEEALKHEAILSEVATNNGVFRIAGTQVYLHELFALPERIVESRSGQCLITGSKGRLARIHEPAIMGLRDGKPFGNKIVAFDDSAYCSYGKDQSYNSPVDIDVAFRYSSTLNYLLEDEDRSITLGDSTIVFWADHASVLEDCLSALFSDLQPQDEIVVEEDKERLRQAKLLLTQLRDGTGNEVLDTSDNQLTRFFLLGLSPNASRISVRLWVEADATELQRRLGQHLRDIALVGGRSDEILTLWRISNATKRWDKKKEKFFKDDKVLPKLAGDLARSVLTGAPYPQSLLATMLCRIHSDGEVPYARVAAIKACLVRNSRLRGNPLEVPIMLDPNSTDPAYCCGRAFALLEVIQIDSAKKKKDDFNEHDAKNEQRKDDKAELNKTIKDSYFSSAGVTPGLVFPRLFRLSQHHLTKLDTGHRIHREKQLCEVLNKLTVFPRLLSLEDQGKFVLGYFHQTKDIYTRKKDKAEGASA